MLVMRTTENPANPLGEFVGAHETVGLDHFALAVDPLRFDGVEPRTLLGQKTTHDPHPLTALPKRLGKPLLIESVDSVVCRLGDKALG
jgi:hypothetical protein